MPVKTACSLSLLLIATLVGYGPNESSSATIRPASAHPEAIVPPSLTPADTAAPLAARLQPIRANYQRINAIRRWSSTTTRNLDEPGEGGEATFYYANGRLEKVVARHFGEMGQQRVDYYLLRGQPSFVLEKTYRYNRPMYYDSAAMQQAHDTEGFAFDSSVVEERRSYFAQGRLVHQISGQVPGVPGPAPYRQQEQQRLLAAFRAVLRQR